MKPSSNNRKLPPFGKLLADRQRFRNPPFLVVICVGCDAWNSAKARNNRGDSVALVLPPDSDLAALSWPVAGCPVVIEWRQGPNVELIVELVRQLLRAGAESVTVWPCWVDYSNPHLEWPLDKPLVKTYRVDMSQGVAIAA
jgi:hypothetical protein